MATSTLITVSEYLATSYRPDCDYVDGEVRERNLGERDHGKIQGFLAFFFYSKQAEWGIEMIPELRVQVKADRFRVPDVCVLDANAPKEQIVRHPPLLCIEVLSPSDTISGLRERVRDYFEMGVRRVWVLDPATRTAIDCVGNTTVEYGAGVLTVPGTPIEVSVEAIFAVLD